MTRAFLITTDSSNALLPGVDGRMKSSIHAEPQIMSTWADQRLKKSPFEPVEFLSLTVDVTAATLWRRSCQCSVFVQQSFVSQFTEVFAK
jgi:hypothetical protein